jgi:hypothetical protein
MRVGVYVDGFNLYYGARTLCGRGTPGWRWLDIRALAGALVRERRDWDGARIAKVIYAPPPSTVPRILLDMLTRMSI